MSDSQSDGFIGLLTGKTGIFILPYSLYKIHGRIFPTARMSVLKPPFLGVIADVLYSLFHILSGILTEISK